jgi:hypothetical protein
MAAQKPTGKGSSRRGVPTGDELPTDLSALATILEAAMTSEEPARSQVANPTIPPGPKIAEPPAPIPDTLDAAELRAPTRRAGEGPARETIAYEEVARSLAAAEACVPLLAQSTGLLRIAALDVVRAETARAGGLLQLIRFLRGDISPPMTAVSTHAVVQRVVQALESEKRLRGIVLITRPSASDATFAGDETLLVNALLTLLLITFAAVDTVANARVMLSATVEDGQIGLAVSQDHVAAPAAWPSRGSDDGAVNPGQAVAAIAINAAHRLAREWRGRFAVASGDHSSILTIWLPVSPPGELEHAQT